MNIKVVNALFKYNKKSNKEIIDIPMLNIYEGTINVVLGLNGSGKSTLIKLLTGLEKCDSGAIFYDELNLSDVKIRERSKIFSYVPQQSIIEGDVLVRDYLSFGTTNNLAFYASPKEDDIRRVERIADKLNITHLLDKRIGEVSGGEKQIILIACALVQNTPIIILDEPTSALDIKNQHLVLTVLKELQKDNKTIILSSHNPNHALYLDADVVLIDGGKVVKTGSSKELINIDVLKEIYGDKITKSKSLDYDEISFKD